MGLNRSLKRSSAIDGKHPEHIRLLENLNIFAVRANYMAQFREYLEREGVEIEGHVELPLAIKPNKSLRRNCDFELKNGSGFYLQGFIAGARFEPTTLDCTQI